MTVGGARAGAFICQEAQFPFIARQSAREGAQLLVSTGNDSIFRNPAVASGHHVAAMFRAIETHRPLVRAMKTGISSIMDPHGRVVAQADLGQHTVLVAAVVPSDERTLYTQWGDWIVGMAAALIALVGIGRVSRRRA